jgi:hypothetical protein
MSPSIRLIALILPALMLTVQGDPPVWWQEGDPPVIDPNAVANPHGPANIGQAKWMANRALETLGTLDSVLAAEIRQRLTQAQPNPDGGMFPATLDFGVPEGPLPSDWHDRQHAPLMIGQLKAIATPFYDQLHAAAPLWLDYESSNSAEQGQLQLNGTKDPEDATNYYPWTADTDDDSNQAIATIGQLKAVFSLRFETLGAHLDDDYDDDGLTNTEEISRGTNPRNTDSDGDGMKDGWETQWGLDPLDAADASADTDGDHVSNLRESQIGSCPTGIYRIEVLPLGICQYFHAAADDGSVVVRESPVWEPDSSLEMITAPDPDGHRTIVPLPTGTWNPLDTIVADLVADGTLPAGDSLNPCGPDSSDGTSRVFQSSDGYLILKKPGSDVRTLAADVCWQAINNHHEAAGLRTREMAATDGIPAHDEQDVMMDYGYYSLDIPLPADWFPATTSPTIQAISDDGMLLIRRPLTNPDGSTHDEFHLLNPSSRTFSHVKQPGLGDESIVSLANHSRMLGNGPVPFLVTPDGHVVPLKDLQIQNATPTATATLSTVYQNPLTPHHITSDGRITLTTTIANNQITLLQLVPDHDADHDGMADDWEISQISYLVTADPQRWKTLGVTRTLDPDTTYWNSPYTAVESYANNLNPGTNLLPAEKDNDQDYVVDTNDADPNDVVVDWKPAVETSYAVIEVERENYSGYQYSLDPVASNTLQPSFCASIGNTGMVLWKDMIQTNGSSSWSSRYRVWKNGVWSPDLKSQSTNPCVAYNGFNISASYVYDMELDTRRTVTVSVSPCQPGNGQMANIYPRAICGDHVIGYGKYSGSLTGLEVMHVIDHDESGNAIKVKRDDGCVAPGVNPVATLWSSETGTPQAVLNLAANPVAQPTEYSLDLPISPFSYQEGGVCTAGSPGGAIAVLGGNITSATRSWRIWTPPTVAGNTPYVPGTGSPTWEKPYVNVTKGRCLQLHVVDDGGRVAGVSWDSSSGWWTMDNRRLLVIDGDGEQELPGGSGQSPNVHALCQIKVGATGGPRLIAAGTNLWVKKDGQWRTAVNTPTVGPVLAVAKDGVLLGSRSLWRNGKEVSLDTLVADNKVAGRASNARFTNLRGYAMNGDGTIVALADDAFNPGDGRKTLIILVPSGIVPDYNRDGMINDEDRGKVTDQKPWRFWNNDDHDIGETSGTDIPHETQEDYCNTSITSMRDLIDYFPVRLDISNMLQLLPKEKYTYWLSYDPVHFMQAPGSNGFKSPFLKVAWNPEASAEPDGTGMNSGAWQRDLDKSAMLLGKQLHFVNPYAFNSTETCIQIPSDMMQSVEAGNGLIWLSSGLATLVSVAPLELKVKDSSNMVVASCTLPLAISSVEDMYRSKYLSENLADGTQEDVPSIPSNWPDTELNAKHFVFVHGYNVSGEQSRGYHSEFFKRMFWSGSNTMFTGVSWHGNESQVGRFTPDYWRNVHNALQTAKPFADFVTALPGEKSVAAHSLGNMVVSSAIADHGLAVANYFMIDAAVALEAYSPGISNKDKMSHPTWRLYQEDLWASEWHKLYPSHDKRKNMTWRGRFRAISNTYNFYSTGEEVLKNGDGTEPGTTGIATNGGKLAWVKQEMSKGDFFLSGGGFIHHGTGGWKFGTYWDNSAGEGLARIHWTRSPQEARTIPRVQLGELPFFKPFVNSKFHDPTLGNAEAAKYDEVAKALSESLPALTFAAGSNPIDLLNSQSDADAGRNYNMSSMKNGWPQERGDDEDWKHGDIREVAYLYTYKVYQKVTQLGGLNK